MALSGTDNIIAALEQSNRVREVSLFHIGVPKLEEILAAMQVPFPELTRLQLWSHVRYDETPPAILDSFLGGFAPRLRTFTLFGIPFPGLPKLLLSATHLVELHLFRIPHSGYISPEVMVALLCALSSLRTLDLQFQSPQSRPDRESRSPPSLKRSILPVLTKLTFYGVTEYLEELVTRIDIPQLRFLGIHFFNQIDSNCPQLPRFINRTPTLMSRADKACVRFDDWNISVTLRARSRSRSHETRITISWGEPDRQLSSVVQVFNSSLHPLSTVEALFILHRYRRRVWKIDANESTLWLRLFRPFTAMKKLYVVLPPSSSCTAAVTPGPNSLDIEVLSSLQKILVEGFDPSEPSSVQENNINGQFINGQFVAARRHSIAITHWGKAAIEHI
jgi:hypothetical protein